MITFALIYRYLSYRSAHVVRHAAGHSKPTESKAVEESTSSSRHFCLPITRHVSDDEAAWFEINHCPSAIYELAPAVQIGRKAESEYQAAGGRGFIGSLRHLPEGERSGRTS